MGKTVPVMVRAGGLMLHEVGECARERVCVRVHGACAELSNGIVESALPQAKQKPRSECFGDLLVAPTGVDPVTFRFSVERSTN